MTRPVPLSSAGPATRPVVTVAFTNGLNFDNAVGEIFGSLAEEFFLVESSAPRLCVSGPYGNHPPPPGALHVRYLCENIWPEPNAYDWCFGVWDEAVVNHPRYTRITWHGFDPGSLVKTPDQVAGWLSRPRRFCNFFYSNPVPHREDFCRTLARYKQVDCPGNSLRNLPPIDDAVSAGKWTRKREFLSGYKFTIAFENSSAPGYHTEKILDPMLAGSIPIYWGDPGITARFNARSFLSVASLMAPPSATLDRLLRRIGRRTFRDYCPGIYSGPVDRLRRRGHRLASDAASALLRRQGWELLISAIRALDQDDALYAAMLAEPWLPDNRPPADNPMRTSLRHLLERCAGG